LDRDRTLKPIRWLVLGLLIISFAALRLSPVAHAAAELSITGTVWDDTNGDGVRQSGEPGSPNLGVELGRLLGGKFVFTDANGFLLFRDAQGRYVRTDTTGQYKFANLEPGSYAVRLQTGTAGHTRFLTYPARRASGEYDVAVTLESQPLTDVNFGLYFAAGVPTYRGIAWINGAPVSEQPRIRIRAFIDGLECTAPGGILPTDQTPNTFLIGVAPASLVPGCGEPGKTVRFTINGQPANETVTWKPLAARWGPDEPPPPPGFQAPWQEQDLTVGASFAYFITAAVDETDFPVFIDARSLRASIDGEECGRGIGSVWASIILVIRSREMTPDCGYEGATIVLDVEGTTVGQPLVWHPGRLEVPLLVVPGAPREGSIRPPSAGDAGLVQP
jgi:hypothetical protein